MGKTQTRRAISVRASTYARLKARADTEGTSVSNMLERILWAYDNVPKVGVVRVAHTSGDITELRR